jgi:hypothetical protein
MTAITYAGITERLRVLNTPIDHNTMQKYVQKGIMARPEYPTPGGAAIFTVHAPLQAYAAKCILMEWIQSPTVAIAREIAEYVEAKFKPVKQKDVKVFADELLKDSAFISMLKG